MVLDWPTRLGKARLSALAMVAISNFLTFVAIITPAWQVAEDLDMNRYHQSGLWMYCPGASQCWYIFSDNLINYYERVDVCRFLLIGDCRKKLLRTPYFFGWHYAVLILTSLSLSAGTLAIATGVVGYWKRSKIRLSTILFDVFCFIAFLLLGIALAVFMINAEMLESRYLIGVKNTFEKEYGYSFFLACLSMLLLIFACLAAIMWTTFVFFQGAGLDDSDSVEEKYRQGTRMGYYAAEKVPQTSTLDSRIQSIPLDERFSRSVTPMSLLPPQWGHGQSASHAPSVAPSEAAERMGTYIPPAHARDGSFTPTTRHFLSY